jgi:hypothetical protein
MELTRENYERYFIDYLDGNIKGSAGEELLEFLGRNPDLMEEFRNLEKMVLRPSGELYPGKAGIRKTIVSLMNQKGLSFEELCVASVEGDLPANENGILLDYLSKDEIREKHFELLKQTRLSPDVSLIYPYKHRLKRLPHAGRIRTIYVTFSLAAASLLALLLVVRPWQDHSGEATPTVQNTVLPEHEQAAYSDKPPVLPEKPVTEKTSVKTVISYHTTPEQISNPASPEREDVRLAEVLSRKAELLDNGINRTDFAVRRFYTGGNNVAEQEYLEPGVFLTDLFREKVLKEDHPDRQDKLSFWELADAGMKGLSNLTTGNFYIDRSCDSSGKMVHLTLETPVFGLSTPIMHKNNP